MSETSERERAGAGEVAPEQVVGEEKVLLGGLVTLAIDVGGTRLKAALLDEQPAIGVSVLRTRGSSAVVAWANCGAIMRQGAHQGAQKSTTTAMLLRERWRSKRASSRARGSP